MTPTTLSLPPRLCCPQLSRRMAGSQVGTEQALCYEALLRFALEQSARQMKSRLNHIHASYQVLAD